MSEVKATSKQNEEGSDKRVTPKSLEDIIREAEFPADYDAFDDENLDMIP